VPLRARIYCAKVGDAAPRRTQETAGPGAALRLVASDGRLVSWRPLVLTIGGLARVGSIRAHTIWPSAAHPYVAMDVGYPPAAEWFRNTMESPRWRFPGAATWNVLRARAVLLGPADGLAVAAAERALGHANRRRRFVLYVHTGHPISKALCFVFEPGEAEPSVVVKAMPFRRFKGRLQAEVERLASVRAVVAHDREVAAALPPAPLYAGEIGDDYVVVEQADPLAGAAGRDDRAAAMSWLEGFQTVSSRGATPWSEEDDADVLSSIDDAWGRARPSSRAGVAERTRALLADLRGSRVPRCAVHGDFWRGNIARDGGRLRIFDWEWAELQGTPMFDRWTYELAELRMRASRGEHDLADPLARALERVTADLAPTELASELALATLPAVLARLAYRIRNATGLDDRMETPSALVMTAVEEVLGCPP
jgi:hypothetical protein